MQYNNCWHRLIQRLTRDYVTLHSYHLCTILLAGFRKSLVLMLWIFHAGQCCRIYVHGKGNKYRSFPLLGETEKIVSKYIKRFCLLPDSPLFCNYNSERLTRQGIRYIIQKYAKMANENTPGIIEGSAYPHILRHYVESRNMVRDNKKRCISANPFLITHHFISDHTHKGYYM